MFDPAAEGIGAINNKFEPYPGFPYYSRESDSPTSWPPRVFRDREALGALYEKFFGRPDVTAAFAAARARRGEKSSIRIMSSAPGGAPDASIGEAVGSARMFFNFTLEDDAAALEREIGAPLAAEFLALEKARAEQRAYFPNRVAIIRVRNTSKQDLKDMTIEFSVTAMIYDVKILAASEGVRESGWDIFENRVVIANLLPKYVLDIVIWYRYQSVDERVFPDKIDFIHDLTQGLTIINIAVSNGKVRYKKELLEELSGYERLYAGDARPKDNYDDDLAQVFERRDKEFLEQMEEYDRKNPTLTDLSLDDLRRLDVPEARISAVWVAFRSAAGKAYSAVHVMKHVSGPYILLVSKDRDEADFKLTQTELASVCGGKAEPNITNRRDDICSEIRVAAGFTKGGIADCFTQLGKTFKDVRVSHVHYGSGD
jgi:hypothetical protein